ncbi:MAG TPA: hypothetical protein VGN02_05670 [Paenibacillus sp.]|uniref:hypothetical protein n=1 Tax=Paenibacillus sp. D2_2 TaxID=3073092 RepID=UPI00281599CE|nr:hypothetical protein [Paenibacillus sp. D2_2]WMT40054.1 hypothetical protein RE628_22475 [Paenibacillus sp. D2_2]
MRQSLKSKVWQSLSLIPAGGSGEAGMLAKSGQKDEFESLRESRPSREYLPRR